MMTMMETKGAEYVAAWPSAMAAKARCTVEDVLAMAQQCYPGLEIGQLVGWQAKRIVRSLAAAHPHCHFCGLATPRDGRCTECV